MPTRRDEDRQATPLTEGLRRRTNEFTPRPAQPAAAGGASGGLRRQVSPSLDARERQRIEGRAFVQGGGPSLRDGSGPGRGGMLTASQRMQSMDRPNPGDMARSMIENRLAAQAPNQTQMANQGLDLQQQESDRSLQLGLRGDETTRRGQDIDERLGMTRDQTLRRGQDVQLVGAAMQEQSRAQAQQAQQMADVMSRMPPTVGEMTTAQLAEFGEQIGPQVEAISSQFGLGADPQRARRIEAQVRRLRGSEDTAGLDPNSVIDLALTNEALADKQSTPFLRWLLGGSDPTAGESMDLVDFNNRIGQLVESGRTPLLFGAARGRADGAEFVFGDLEGHAADQFQRLVEQRRDAILTGQAGPEAQQRLVDSELSEIEKRRAELQGTVEPAERRTEARDLRGAITGLPRTDTRASAAVTTVKQAQGELEQLDAEEQRLREILQAGSPSVREGTTEPSRPAADPNEFSFMGQTFLNRS